MFAYSMVLNRAETYSLIWLAFLYFSSTAFLVNNLLLPANSILILLRSILLPNFLSAVAAFDNMFCGVSTYKHRK